MAIKVLLQGGGDLASGVALRMVRAGLKVVICELAQPYAVRRSVSFAEVVYAGNVVIEGIAGRLATSHEEAMEILASGRIPVLVDPDLNSAKQFSADVIVDGRMMKAQAEHFLEILPKIIGMGPGFTCGLNCHAAVETKRGPNLGRVIWNGSTEEDTGIPENVGVYGNERVIRSSSTGIFHSAVKIGEAVKSGQVLGNVDQEVLLAPFGGMVRGILQDGLPVMSGLKIGDIDPRFDQSLIHKVSDKALSIGGGVMEAIFSWPEFRQKLLGD